MSKDNNALCFPTIFDPIPKVSRGSRESTYAANKGPIPRESWRDLHKLAPGEELPAPTIAIVPDTKALLANTYERIRKVLGDEPSLAEVLQTTADVLAVFQHVASLEDREHKRGADFDVDPDEARAAWARRDELTLDLERLNTALERLRGPAKQAAAEREEQARRLVAYDHAKDLCDTAAEMVAKAKVEWDAALAKAAHAAQLAQAVNVALPIGMRPIVIPPACADEQIVSTREVERWCVDGTDQTFDDAQVVPPDRPHAPAVLRPHPARFVVRRVFREVTYTKRGSNEQHVRYETAPQPQRVEPETLNRPAPAQVPKTREGEGSSYAAALKQL